MKSIALGLAGVLAVAAFVSGVLSARYWYHSSQASPAIELAGVHTRGMFEPLDALYDYAVTSAELNERAAKWTAITIGLGTLSNLLSILSNYL
jgi:hypothetical protein